MTDTTVRPFVDIGGVRFPLDTAGGTRPRLTFAPTQAFPDAVTFGDASKLVDQRTRALVYTDTRGGMGEYQGPNGQLPAQQLFTTSNCDTRFERSLILAPQPVDFGSALPGGGNRWIVEYPNTSTAQLIAWQAHVGSMSAYIWPPGGPAWVPLVSSVVVNGGTAIHGIHAFVRFGGRFHIVADFSDSASNKSALYSSADGATWVPSGGRPFFDISAGVEFNNLFWVWAGGNRNQLMWSVDPYNNDINTAVGQPGAWGVSATLALRPGEQVYQLLTARNARNEPALFVLSNQRLLRFDQDLDTPLTPGFFTVHDFGARVDAASVPTGHVWLRDQQLYLTLGNVGSNATGPIDAVVQLGPASASEVGPNIHGGLPPESKFAINHLTGSQHWLYAFCQARNGGTGTGCVLVLNGLGGWHTLAEGGQGDIVGNIVGGGYANGQVWIVTDTGATYSIKDPDVPDLPVYLQPSQRAYAANQWSYHETSWHGGGLENIRKVLQHLAIDCRYNNGTVADAPGLPSATQVSVDYRTETSAGWVSAGANLTSAGTFPAEFKLNGGLGVKCRRFKLRIGLYTTDPTQTPNVVGFEAHFVPKPREHYQYTARLDLLEGGPAFLTPESTFGPYTSQDLQRKLLALADGDTLTTVAWGGDDPTDANYTLIGAAQIKLGGAQDSDSSSGPVTVTIIDLTPPVSGG